MNCIKSKAVLCLFSLAALSGSLFAQSSGPCAHAKQVIVSENLLAWFPMAPTLNSAGQATQAVADCSGNSVQANWSAPNPPNFNVGPTGGTPAAFFPYPAGAPKGATAPNYIDIASIGIPAEFTISVWSQMLFPNSYTQAAGDNRLAEFGTYGPVASKGYPGGFYLGTNNTPLGVNADGTDLFGGSYQFIVNDANAATLYGSCQGGTVDGKSHMVTGTYSGNAKTGVAFLYVDGQQVAGPCHYQFNGLASVHGRIGTYDNYPSTPLFGSGNFPGAIWDVRLYYGALTAAEVQTLYAATIPQ